jgi:MFS family permease
VRTSSLKHPTFTRFWLAETATVLAYQMLTVAVAWQTYELTDSALSLGLVGLVQVTPVLVFALISGHAADRYDRRRIALASQVAQCAVAITFAATSFAGALSPHVIYGGSFLIGTALAFQSPSVRSLLPALVERSELPRCIAWSGAARKIAVITGPGLGGLIYVLGPAAVYATSAVFFVGAGILFASIRMPGAIRPRAPVTLETLFGGIEYIRRHRVILGAISLDLFAMLLGGTTALLPIYARDILATGPSGLGMLRAAPAVGAVCVSIALVRVPLMHHVGRVMFACVAIFGLGTIVFGVSRSVPLSLAALIVMGGADMISVLIRTSLIQLDTPDAMRGRVSAVNSLCTNTSNQLGQFESGVTAALFGTVPAVVIGGVGTLVIAGLWMRWFPALYERDSLTSRTH